MATEDWAIVVGISRYPHPELAPLAGPERDAKDFHDWLIAPTGGDVPPNQAKLILSSDYPAPASPTAAQPTVQAVSDWFDQLLDLADSNNQKGTKYNNVYDVGRRLYVYLAGHGISTVDDEAALLMANWTPKRAGYNLAGRPWLQFFMKAGYFAEGILFMDCCRDYLPRAMTGVPLYTTVAAAAGGLATAKTLYAFATKWSHRSREWDINQDGNVRGVFTTALLKGLRGKACEINGEVTADSLSQFLRDELPKLLPPGADSSGGESQQPDLIYDTAPTSRLVLAKMKPPLYPITIQFKPQSLGHNVRIIGDGFTAIKTDVATAAPWDLELGRGIYLIMDLVSGDQLTFELPKQRGSHVNI